MDCGVHYIDVMLQITDSPPVQVRGMGVRLSDEIAPAQVNYGHLQVLFGDGSVGWYEAGWGPMISETAFFVKDVMGPRGAVSIVAEAGAASAAIDTHTATSRLRIHAAACGPDGRFLAPDEVLTLDHDPGHDELCAREQRFMRDAILEDRDLGRHMDEAGAVARGGAGGRPLHAREPRHRPLRIPQMRAAVQRTATGMRDGMEVGGALALTAIRKSFGEVDVLKGVDLSVEPGEFVVFVGPSGCGKSTLLRIIAGLDEQTSGDLRIDGKLMNGVPPAKRGIAMVFQSYALYPHLTVSKNMSLALSQEGVAAAEIAARVAKASGLLRLDPLLQRRPAELSGGQRQRVAIGRAIVREPSLFLFDEPLSNLDAALRVGTRIEIAKLHRQLGATMIYVTHDQVEAMTLADKIVVMQGGAIEQVGRPLELYARPANLFVAGFIGSPTMNFVAGETAARVGAATIGVRPEHLKVGSDGAWTGNIAHAEHLGADTMLYVEVPEHGLVTARVLGDARTLSATASG